MEVNIRINQIWNLPETLWQTFSRPQDLSPEAHRALLVGTVGLGILALLYNQYKKMLHEPAALRPVLKRTTRFHDLSGYDSDTEDSPKPPPLHAADKKTSETVLKKMRQQPKETPSVAPTSVSKKSSLNPGQHFHQKNSQPTTDGNSLIVKWK